MKFVLLCTLSVWVATAFAPGAVSLARRRASGKAITEVGLLGQRRGKESRYSVTGTPERTPQ